LSDSFIAKLRNVDDFLFKKYSSDEYINTLPLSESDKTKLKNMAKGAKDNLD